MSTNFLIVVYAYWIASFFINVRQPRFSGTTKAIYSIIWFPLIFSLSYFTMVTGKYVSEFINYITGNWLANYMDGIYFPFAGPIVISPVSVTIFILLVSLLNRYSSETKTTYYTLEEKLQLEQKFGTEKSGPEIKIKFFPKHGAILLLSYPPIFFVVIHVLSTSSMRNLVTTYMIVAFSLLQVVTLAYIFVISRKKLIVNTDGLIFSSGLFLTTPFPWENIQEINIERHKFSAWLQINTYCQKQMGEDLVDSTCSVIFKDIDVKANLYDELDELPEQYRRKITTPKKPLSKQLPYSPEYELKARFSGMYYGAAIGIAILFYLISS